MVVEARPRPTYLTTYSGPPSRAIVDSIAGLGGPFRFRRSFIGRRASRLVIGLRLRASPQFLAHLELRSPPAAVEEIYATGANVPPGRRPLAPRATRAAAIERTPRTGAPDPAGPANAGHGLRRMGRLQHLARRDEPQTSAPAGVGLGS